MPAPLRDGGDKLSAAQAEWGCRTVGDFGECSRLRLATAGEKRSAFCFGKVHVIPTMQVYPGVHIGKLPMCKVPFCKCC